MNLRQVLPVVQVRRRRQADPRGAVDRRPVHPRGSAAIGVVQWAKYEIFDPRQQIADNQSQKDSDPGHEATRSYRQRNDEQHDD